MTAHRIIVVGLLFLSACSSSQVTGSASCDSVGLTPGTPAYEQCADDARLRSEVAERMLFKTNNNKPLAMLAQQSTKPMMPLLNCTSYAMPLSGAPTMCD